MEKYEFFGKSDVGRKRDYNEDAYAIRPDLSVCMAADGMGGAAAGEIASGLFIETAQDVFEQKKNHAADDILQLVKKSFIRANGAILAHVEKFPEHQGMGCTAELLAFSDDGFVIGHMGDSRTYRMRENRLKQLTRDHSLVQEQIDQGLISERDAKTHSMRNVVLRAIGVEKEISLDVLTGSVLPGDQFLLCSDGLTDMIEEKELAQTMSAAMSLPQKVEHLIHLANEKGGVDNITVVMAAVNYSQA